MGLAFELEEGGQRTVSKTASSPVPFGDGLSSDKGIGVVTFSITGGLDGRNATEPPRSSSDRVACSAFPPHVLRKDIPPHPETWSELSLGTAPPRVLSPPCSPERSWGPVLRSLLTAGT